MHIFYGIKLKTKQHETKTINQRSRDNNILEDGEKPMQSQELFGKAIKKQTAATSHATETIPIETLDTF